MVQWLVLLNKGLGSIPGLVVLSEWSLHVLPVLCEFTQDIGFLPKSKDKEKLNCPRCDCVCLCVYPVMHWRPVWGVFRPTSAGQTPATPVTLIRVISSDFE